MFEAMNKESQIADPKSEGDQGQPGNSCRRRGSPSKLPTPSTVKSFSIRSGPFLRRRYLQRPALPISASSLGTARQEKQLDGSFVAYSGDDLETKAKELGAKGTSGQWIKELRDDIKERLRDQANIISGRRDVILSSGPGYRLAESVSVQFGTPSAITDITDTEDGSDVRNGDVRGGPNDLGNEAAIRRAWVSAATC
jgi:hypothetical protein